MRELRIVDLQTVSIIVAALGVVASWTKLYCTHTEYHDDRTTLPAPHKEAGEGLHNPQR